MGYKMIRLSACNGGYTAIATIEKPGLSFIDLIFWLVGLVFGGSQTKDKFR
ncbi:MAG: hypothetical protein ABSB91_04500 [Sedimentisphaerales bacterium]|jgi:hypothetical protein